MRLSMAAVNRALKSGQSIGMPENFGSARLSLATLGAGWEELEPMEEVCSAGGRWL